MTKNDFRDINELSRELLRELLKISMSEAVDTIWNKSKEELIKSFKKALATPDDENRPSLFFMIHTVGLIGTVLVSKYGKDENELMKMLKDSNALFVKRL